MSLAQPDALRLNSLVDKFCLDKGVPFFGYDEAHQCTKECTMLGSYPKYICVHSRKLHLCGRCHCRHGYSTSEGTFCMLTGNELYGPEENVSRVVVRDSCGASTRHWGEEITACGKRKRAQRQSTDFYQLFEKALRLFLCSEDRKSLYEYEIARYETAVKRATKKECTGMMTLAEAAEVVRGVWQKHRLQCTLPLSNETRWISTLARKIYLFWKQTRVSMTRKSVPSLAAVALSLMAKPTGYVLKGVVYVKPSQIVAKHSVTDMQFGRFPGLTCRRMSIIVRELMKSLLTKDGQQRIIKPLDFGTV